MKKLNEYLVRHKQKISRYDIYAHTGVFDKTLYYVGIDSEEKLRYFLDNTGNTEIDTDKIDFDNIIGVIKRKGIVGIRPNNKSRCGMAYIQINRNSDEIVGSIDSPEDFTYEYWSDKGWNVRY